MALLLLLAGLAPALPIPLRLDGPHAIAGVARRLQTADGSPAPVPDLTTCFAVASPASAGETLVVPAGECYKITSSTALTLRGIHVVGHLVIDASGATSLAPIHVSVMTEYLFVEGVLTIAMPEDAAVPSVISTVTITLAAPATVVDPFFVNPNGDVDLMFHSLKHPSMTPHAVGIKAFVVAGGQLDIGGLPAISCPAWTKLANVETDPAFVPSSVVQPTPLPTGCTEASYAPIRSAFASAEGQAGWSTDSSAQLTYEMDSDGTLYAKVSARTKRWSGYLTYALEAACLVPGDRYRFVALVRSRNETDGKFSSTTCARTKERCLMATIDSAATTNEWLDKSLQSGSDAWQILDDEFAFSAEDLAAGNTHTVRFYGPDAGETIEVKFARLERMSPAFYQPAGGVPETCHQLARNSGAELSDAFPWPWASSSSTPKLTVATQAATVGESAEGVHHLRLAGRTSSGHMLRQEIELGCLEPGATYAISAKVRLPPGAPCTSGSPDSCARIELDMQEASGSWRSDTIARQAEFVDGGWNLVSGRFALREHHTAALGATIARLELKVDDGSAVADWVEWDDVTVTFISGPVRTLVLEPSVASCWAAGAELLLTSHTLRFEDAQVATIAGITAGVPGDALDGKTRVRLASHIERPTTEEDSPDFAIEVALLSRNVVIRGGEDALATGGNHIGGHLMIMHTPGVAQTVRGVLFEKMGQQGRLGRYPLHLHLSGVATNSVLSHNVVRNSFQRCIVLHGTDGVLVSDNVAFETKGHCFMLEDGGERFNSFVRNLGASTRAVATSIRAEETDDDPSTFWMTNPENSWVGNVAAGSQQSGFWMELRTRVRAPTRGLWLPDDYNPKVQPLLAFKSNVAHSNGNDGLQTYPSGGYTPRPIDPSDPDKVGARFEDFKSFRNRAAGVFFHNSFNIEVSGGMFADNRRGIDIDRSHTCTVVPSRSTGEGAAVLGVTSLYAAQLEAMGKLSDSSRSLCSHATATPVVGVQVHSQSSGGDGKRGPQLRGLRFGRFTAAETGCARARALGIDDEDEGYFDARASVSGLSWEPAGAPPSLGSRLSFCVERSTTAAEALLNDTALRDVDGSLTGAAGFIVSNSARMTALVPPPGCTSIAGSCAAVCPGVCLRQLVVRVQSYVQPGVVLRLSDSAGRSALVPARVERRMEDTPLETTLENSEEGDRAEFFVTAPAGAQLLAEFALDGGAGAAMWPLFAQTRVLDEPGACSEAALELSFAVPPRAAADCAAQMVANGDFAAAGTSAGGSATEPPVPSGWWHNGGGVLLKTDGAGQFAESSARTASWHGPSQWLDSRCVTPAMAGGSLVLRALVKAYGTLANGEPDDANVPRCFVDGSECVRSELRVEYSAASGKPPLELDFGAQSGFVYGEWNLLAGSLELTAAMLDGLEAVRVQFEGPAGGVAIALDDVTLSYAPPVAFLACSAAGDATTSLVANGGFASADEFGVPAVWASAALTDQLLVVSGTDGSEYARSFSRTSTNHGPTQLLNPDCWTAPVSYRFRADVKLVTPDGVMPHCLNAATAGSDCPEVELKITTADGATHYVKGGALYSPAADGWSLLAAELRYGLQLAEAPRTVRLGVEGPESGVEILLDNISLVRLPELSCTAAKTDGLLANRRFAVADADNLPAHWAGRHGSAVQVAIYPERGAVGRSFGRRSTYDGPLQRLVEGCHGVAAGTSLVMHAWVKIVVPPGASSECATNRDRCIRCTRLSTDSAGARTHRNCGHQLTRAAGVWSLLEAQFTLEADEADGVGDWHLYFEGPEPANEILVDDVWLGEVGTLVSSVAAQ